MKAFPDSKCAFGYSLICKDCHKKPRNRRLFQHIDFDNPILIPISLGVAQECDICGRVYAVCRGDDD